METTEKLTETEAPQLGADETVDTTEKVEIKAKPLPENKFKAAFVGLYRKWLGKWYGFSDKHKKMSELIYTVFFFLVFSVGVTIYQYIVMTFLPYAFASLNNGPWGVPNTPIKAAGGQPYVIFGDAQGFGYFIAFEIATFTAQCINFPLQRNITYRSHGNIAWQIMWYFIGWALISVFTLALWGIINCFMVYWGVPDAATGLLKTLITGAVSMVIFFFIFMIIFPNRKKVADKLDKKLEKAKAKNADAAKIEKLEKRARAERYAADLAAAEREAAKATAFADAKAVAYEAAVSQREALVKKNASEQELSAAQDYIDSAYASAVDAVEKRAEAVAAYEKIKQTPASEDGSVDAAR